MKALVGEVTRCSLRTVAKAGWFLPGLCVVVATAACSQPSTDAPAPASSETEGTTSPTDGGLVALDGGPSFNQCAAVAVEANEVPANMLFVLDSSGSMNCVPPNGDAAEAKLCKTDPRKRGDGPSKWQVTYEALAAALEPLVGRSNLNIAVTAFPLYDTRCDVAAEPELDFAPLDAAHLDAISALLSGVRPDGETPVAGATILGYSAISRGLREATLRGNASIVLLTDGEETCKPDELEKLVTQDAPMALEGFGIRTFVIAAPGSEDASLFLSRLAHAGGTDSVPGCNFIADSGTPNCHFDMTKSVNFEQDLADVLDEITRTKALTCEFDVPRNPEGGAVDLGKVNVTLVEAAEAGVERTPIGKHEGPIGSCDDKDDGWTYSDDRKRILVCGSDCETVKASVDAQVQIVLGCRSLSRGDIR